MAAGYYHAGPDEAWYAGPNLHPKYIERIEKQKYEARKADALKKSADAEAALQALPEDGDGKGLTS